MNTIIKVGICLTAYGACFAYAPAASQGSEEDLKGLIEQDRFNSMTMRTSITITPDGKKVLFPMNDRSVAANTSTSNVWLKDVAKGTPPRKVTDEPVSATPRQLTPVISPDGQRFAYISAKEPSAVNVVDLETGERTTVRPLLAAEEHEFSISEVDWSPDGARMAVVYTATLPMPQLTTGVSVTSEFQGLEPSPLSKLAVVDVRTGRVLSTSAAHRNVAYAKWSPKGDWIAYYGNSASKVATAGAIEIRQITAEDEQERSKIYLFNSRTGAELSIDDTESSPGPVQWSPNGQKLASFIRRSYRNPNAILVFDWESQSKEFVDLGPEGMFLNLAWISNYEIVGVDHREMKCPIYKMNVASKVLRPLSSDQSLSCYNGLASAPRAGKIAFLKHDFVLPTEIYISDIHRWKPVPILPSGSNPAQIEAEVRVLAWPSHDGRFTIHGVLVVPKDRHKGPRPLILSLNGGPSMVMASGLGGAHAVNAISPMLQRGFAVLMPNTRGRGGFGAAFQAAMPENKDYLKGPFHDAMGGVDLLERLGVADPDRMAVIGFSYGGTLTGYTVTQESRFKAAVIGDASGLDMVESGYQTAMNYGDYIERSITGFGSVHSPQDKMARTENSVVALLDKVSSPVLLECGALSNGRLGGTCHKMFKGLQYFKVHTKLIVYPRTGHGIAEPVLKYDSEIRRLEWLDYWVLGKPVKRMVEEFGPPRVSLWEGLASFQTMADGSD